MDTSTPSGAEAPAAGYIDSAEYDQYGNFVRSLEATNRLLALGQLPTAGTDLASLGLTAADTATRAMALSTLKTYSTDGLDLLRERGPRFAAAAVGTCVAAVLLLISRGGAGGSPVRAG